MRYKTAFSTTYLLQSSFHSATNIDTRSCKQFIPQRDTSEISPAVTDPGFPKGGAADPVRGPPRSDVATLQKISIPTYLATWPR